MPEGSAEFSAGEISPPVSESTELVLPLALSNNARNAMPTLVTEPLVYPHLQAFGQLMFVNTSLWAAARYVLQEPYARISLTSVKNNLANGWVLDDNAFLTNQLGHPLQGSLVYTAARAQGLSFWESAMYPIVSSYLWETFMEKESPSINDMITTPMSGITYGEISHRLGLLLLEENPGWSGEIFSALLNPVLAFNRLVHGRDRDFYPRIHEKQYFAGISYGFGGYLIQEEKWIASKHFLRAHIFYGDPFKAVKDATPFDYFSFVGILNFHDGEYVGEIYSNGTLKSLWVKRVARYSVMTGIFKDYDFMNQELFRVSSSSLGLGLVQRVQLPFASVLYNEIQLSGIAMGGAGDAGSAVAARGYYYGPGFSGKFLLMISKANLGRLYLRLKRYFIYDLEDFRRSRYEEVNLLKTGFHLAIWSSISLGGELTMASRGSVTGSAPYKKQKRGIVQFHLIYNMGKGA